MRFCAKQQIKIRVLDSDSSQFLLRKNLSVLYTGISDIFVVFGASGCIVIAELEVNDH
jgi:hypothetical protein